MANLITKANFAGIAPNFSQNIEDGIIEPHIRDAELYDFKGMLPAAFYTAITGTRGANLETFFATYIKPYLVLCAYKRFILYAGKNLTQYGMIQLNEPTSQAVTDKHRGEMIADCEQKASVRLTLMYNRLVVVAYTFDTVIYDFAGYTQETTSRRRSIGVKAVKMDK